MPRRAFVSDLSSLTTRAEQIPNVTAVERGDDDGTFTFVWEAPGCGFDPVEFTGMIPELAEYPDSHQAIVWATDEAPAWMVKALDRINVNGVALRELLAAVSTAFGAALAVENGVEIDSEEELEEEEEEEEEDEEDESVGGWSEDEVPHPNSGSQMVDGPATASIMKQLREDLRQAKAAGFKVGVLGEWKGGTDLYVSVAIRISKLGISEQAVSAWKLDRSKYFIVLIHYTQNYQTLKSITSDFGGYHGRKGTEICVGMHKNYKPTLAQAIGAFSKVGKGMESQGQHVIGGEEVMNGEDGSNDTKEDAFEGIFISGPLNDLLNSRLKVLLKYRIQLGFTWDGAEAFYNENQGRENADLNLPEERYYEVRAPRNAHPEIVTSDAMQQSTPAAESFPLLAMQFALRHLVRCTEFCLVCHNQVTSDFEALKPYVCSNPLCLYQYMSLGFGPSIEYEIISQPSVVDLLVSFCYSAASARNLKDFPDGMNLMVPDNRNPPRYTLNYNRFKQEIIFDPSETEGRGPLRVGDWICITIDMLNDTEWHARVIETEYYPMVKISQPIAVVIPVAPIPVGLSPVNIPPSIKPARPTAPPSEELSDGNSQAAHVLPGLSDIIEIKFRIYDQNFDSIAEEDKQMQIVTILNTLPAVEEMKDWLQKNTKIGEEACLNRWQAKISPAALGVLRWIIASNRSCIVALNDDGSKKSGHEKRVHGMPEYTQFRFAMGAPDKEQRFVNSVRDMQNRLGQSQYPTLFAFHGSPLQNWHSIIREGLNFRDTAHGRAYGHGCYHSLHLAISLGYCHNHLSNPICWPHSKLKFQTVVCLNEIVNAPQEFVSSNPHLVVSQLDWIQTRYLFVGGWGDPHSLHHNAETVIPEHIHPQDPKYTPKGHSNFLTIPATTLGRSDVTNVCDAMDIDQPAVKQRKTKKGKARGASVEQARDVGLFDDDVSVCTDTEDHDALLSDHEDANSKAIANTAPPTPTRPDAFIPGTLDYSSIPFLPPPSYASSMATKRLQADMNHLLKLQSSTPLSDLGFYLDPSRISNVYQWIVELHSFPPHLPLVSDMRSLTPPLTSIVLELRFGPQYPMSPPWIRVVTPRFLGFAHGGGGHITVGGALCMQLLTNSGWSAVNTIEAVLLQVRMEICEENPPARLEGVFRGGLRGVYGVLEAKEAFVRACRTHGWVMPDDFESIAAAE